ncbi:MAG: hypothetical protein ACREFP_19175 [Acetobacteraceae bacterium]
MASSFLTLSGSGLRHIFTPPASSQSSEVVLLPVGDVDEGLRAPAGGLRDLHSLTLQIAAGLPVSLAPEVEAMIERAARAPRAALTVEWAHRLAQDVADLAD